MRRNSTQENAKLICADSVEIEAIEQEMIRFDSKVPIFHESAIFLD